jgi:hypothetical protein
MNVPPRALRIPAFAAALAFSLLTPSHAFPATLELGTVWADTPVVVDGNLDDWKGRLITTVNEPLAIGASNDGEFLYVGISSSDEQTARRAFFRGMVVWIKPKRGSEIGIQYPTGGPRGPRGRGVPGATSDEAPAEAPAETFILLGQGSSDGQRVAVDNPFGIEMKATFAGGQFTYELRVPLHRSAAHSIALDAKDGASVTLEVESVEPVRAGPPPGEGGSGGGGEGGMHRHGGGMGGMGGYGHGGGMEGGGHDRGEAPVGRPAPLKVTAKLHLAMAPTRG